MDGFIKYFISRLPEIGRLLNQHIKISGIALLIAIFIGVPIGILITKSEKVSKITLSIAGIGMGMTNFQLLLKVKLPIALSVIMDGIRIATVSIIDTTTIAALIGAGGLGDLIFRGIATSNNYLVLCGAIPTAILAFVANYFLGILEKALAPLSNKSEKQNNRKILIGVAVILLSFSLFQIQKYINKDRYFTVRVGHKTFTEQRILGNMISILIEKNTPYKVILTELGGTNINFEAIKTVKLIFIQSILEHHFWLF